MAAGLGKPVIYTCRRSFYEKGEPFAETGGVHFDISHDHMVLWEPGQLEQAGSELKLVIRATLPGQAKLHDDDQH